MTNPKAEELSKAKQLKMHVDACIRACSEIPIRAEAHEKEELVFAIQTFGYNYTLWCNAVSQVKDQVKRGRKNWAPLTSVTQAYENLCERYHHVECGNCQKSGYLNVIVLFVKRSNYEQVFIYDPQSPAHRTFLDKMAASVDSVTGEQRYLPCTCENGEKVNKRDSGTKEWLTRQNRQRAYQRCFVETIEGSLFAQEEHLRLINNLNKGIGYKPKTVEEEYDKASHEQHLIEAKGNRI